MQPYAIRFTSLDNKTMQTQSKKGYLQHSIAKMRRKVQTIKDCSIFMDNNIAKSIVQNCTALQQCSAVRHNITDDRYMDKTTLDNILEKHKAQPVGHGYIDVIVSRDNYKDFISDLVTTGYKIDSVSWWEWCEDKKENEYGLGGPESVFYKGWFSEIPVNVDDFSFSAGTNKEYIIKEILNKIETKTISFSDETVTFKESNWLTPAIWLDVPDEWRNKYSA